MKKVSLLLVFIFATIQGQASYTLWTKPLAGSKTDLSKSVQQTTDGGYIITGTTKFFGNGNDDICLFMTDSQVN